MALTKVTGDVVSPTSDYTINNVTGVAATFTGNVSIGGTLTYQDVTNIDAVGIITAQKGIQVLADGLNVTGVTTINAPVNQTLLVNRSGGHGQSSVALQSNGTTKWIVGSDKNSGNSQDFFIYDQVTGAHRFNINADGRVGINSEQPTTAQLVVRNTDDSNKNTIEAWNDNGNVSTSISQDSSGAGSLAQKDNSGNIKTHIRSFDSSYFLGGNIGIGTADPQTPLHINSTNPTIRLTDLNQAADNKSWNITAGQTQLLRIQSLNDAGSGGGSLFDFYRSGNNVQEFRAMKGGSAWFTINNSTQRVGIGTTTPDYFIHVESPTPYIRVKDTAAPTDEKTWDFNAGTDGILRFRNTNDAANSSNNWLEVERDGVATDSIRLLTGSGGERLRITSDGDVGINVTPTNDDMVGVKPRLHVLGISTAGQFNTVARFESGPDNNDSGAAVVINHTNDRGLVIQGGRGGDADGVHHANSGLARFSIINNAGTFHKFMEAWGQNGQYIENISLFTGNQVEALRIKSDGNIGVGTADPTRKLHVFGDGDTKSIVAAVAGDALFDLSNTGNGNYSGINFTRERSTGSVVGGSIWMPSVTANNSALLYLQTQTASAQAGVDSALVDNNGVRVKLASQPGGVGADSAFSVEVGASERLRITSTGHSYFSGNLGIGTAVTTPATTLHLDSGGTPTTIQIDSDTESSIDFNDHGGSAKRYKIGTNISDNSGQFEIKDITANVERLRIKSDGETNIGTGAVNIAKFCIDGNYHQIVGQAADDVAALDVYSQHGNDGDRLSFAVSDNRTGSKSNSFVVRGNGHIGIGTDNPVSALDVRNASGTNPLLSLHHSVADVEGEVIRIGRVAPYHTIRYHSIKAQHGGAVGNNYIGFSLHNGTTTTSQTEVMRIVANGRVAIGTDGYGNTAPLAPLHVSSYSPTDAITDHNTLRDASQLVLQTSNNVNDSKSGLMFSGALHSTDGCSAGIVATHENVAENSESTSLSFFTSNSETLGLRLSIAADGQLIQNLNHASGSSAHQDTSWYGDGANDYTLEHRDFNELYAAKTDSSSNYNSIVYRRETMTSWCDIEFDMTGGEPPSTTYRHVGFAINGDGSDTWSNMDRLVLRYRPGSTTNNQVRLDTGGSVTGFNVTGSSITNFFDGTRRHYLLQIRGREFTITVDGVRMFSGRNGGDLVRSHGFFGFCIYESSASSTWLKIANFKIKNYSEQWVSPRLHEGHASDATQVTTGSKKGKMEGKRVHTGPSSTQHMIDLLTIDQWQSTNSRIIVKVNVMAISPVAEIGFFAFGSGYCRRHNSNTTSTSYVVNTMELEQRFGTSSDYGALDWSGQTLRYECPAVEYLDLHIDVEYHTYDGATVSFDTRYRQMS